MTTFQVYHHFIHWEDWQNGQFSTTCDNENVLKEKCVYLLSNPKDLYVSMSNVVSNWHYSSAHNLSNIQSNRKAWLGQAACCYAFAAPDYVTKMAWNTLPVDVKRVANSIADKVISQWEIDFFKLNVVKNQLSLFEYGKDSFEYQCL